MNKFYLKEFQFFDGENTVVFNIVAVAGKKSLMHVSRFRIQARKSRSFRASRKSNEVPERFLPRHRG